MSLNLRAIKLFLLLLFVSYMAGTSLFYHAHVLDGKVVFHSHPYKKVDFPSKSTSSHSHARDEFVFYQHNQGLFFEDSQAECTDDFLITGCTVLIESTYCHAVMDLSLLLHPLRGPPHRFTV